MGVTARLHCGWDANRVDLDTGVVAGLFHSHYSTFPVGDGSLLDSILREPLGEVQASAPDRLHGEALG